MVRGDLVKLFRRLEGKYRWCRSTRESFRSQLSVGCSDGMAYKYAACGRLWLLSPVCERHARPAPGAGREVGFEEGDAEVYSGNDTGRARTPHLLPSPCYGRQVVSSGVQAETRQNSPNINQARDGS